MTESLHALALPLTLPLRGTRLVEASAGTGKTWTIAALYVRLVLGHGEGLGRPLAPAEILVMTFTKAATRELSDRIRRRLVEAAAFFRSGGSGDGSSRSNSGAGGDQFLQTLRETYPPGPERTAAAWRLAAAAEAMDDAAVHTIDAWCQRMLREHAFDSACLFDEELQPNETQMLRQAAQDYWRQQVYPLEGEALAEVLRQWGSVGALVADVQRLVEKPLPEPPPGHLAEVVAGTLQAVTGRIAQLKQPWPQRVAAMRQWLEREWACTPKRIALQARHTRGWLDELDAWANAKSIAPPTLSDTAWLRLTRADLLEQAKGPLPADLPAGFDAIAELRAELSALPQLPPLLRAHALARVRERMQHLKQQAGRYGYADMLERLDDALDEGRRGAHARQLRERIVEQYPAALIDEFQDTSPRQLSIFERVYHIADNHPARVLLLIGDPKQSIYAFRGADIHSYLQARRATAGRHHALAANRRSTRPLVQAVNALFERAEARPGRGAFLFRVAGETVQAAEEGLPFSAVRFEGPNDVLQRAGQDLPALTFCVDPVLATLAEHRLRFAALCAERIVGLLADASTAFVGAGAAPRRLRPGDIAVLVRTGVEAETVQRALRQRGVASVYLSDKDSVYQRPEAADLLRLLQAVAAPRQVRLARAAFATRLLGRTLPELLHLATDDLAFDALAEHLRTLHGLWQTQGVLAMLRRALHLFEIPARLLAGGNAGDGEGERRLTNVLHLAELLQAASSAVAGEPALVRWLAGQIEAAQDDFTPAEELVLRLESDADLVQVVTVHKAKGLEYDVVFVPFASGYRDGQLDDWVVARDAAGRRRQLDLAPSKAALQAHDEQRLQEDLRLLYVALTRARHALWVGAAALKFGSGRDCQWHRSALGYLVSGEQPCLPDRIAFDLQVLAEATPSVAVQVLAEATPVPITRWQPPAADAALPPARVYDGTFDRRWALASYSAVVRDAVHGVARAAAAGAPQSAIDSATLPPAPLLTRVQRDEDDDDDEGGVPLADAGPPADRADRADRTDRADRADHIDPADRPWHRFPRGAFAGNFLHNQLEWLAGEGFALADSPKLREALLRRCERQGWGHRGAEVAAWLERVVSQPLPPLGAALAGLPGRVLPEMEFWLPADGLDIGRLDALCREHLFPQAPRPALTPRVLHGLLMGFADLVFEHAGAGAGPRHWVLDYKSNALGTRDADYTEAALQAAMLRHRYDVQAALYLLALHRLLRRRLAERYEPARDLGGAIYYFLRGVAHGSAGCRHVQAPPALLHALEATLP